MCNDDIIMNLLIFKHYWHGFGRGYFTVVVLLFFVVFYTIYSLDVSIVIFVLMLTFI